MNIQSLIEQRVHLEDRIRKAGGTIPAPWPWADIDPVIRNLQLLEYAEDLEHGRPLPHDMAGANILLQRKHKP